MEKQSVVGFVLLITAYLTVSATAVTHSLVIV